MTGPIDIIREALGEANADPDGEWMAALMEVEHQLAAAKEAIQDAKYVGFNKMQERAVAAERRANELADALREVRDIAYVSYGTEGRIYRVARAALDRHTQTLST